MNFVISKYNGKTGKDLNKSVSFETPKNCQQHCDKLNSKLKEDEYKWRISVYNA